MKAKYDTFSVFQGGGIASIRRGRCRLSIPKGSSRRRYKVSDRLLGVGDIINIRELIGGVWILTGSCVTIRYIDNRRLSYQRQDETPRTGWSSVSYRNIYNLVDFPKRVFEKVCSRQVAPISKPLAEAIWKAITAFSQGWRPRTQYAKVYKASFIVAMTDLQSFGCELFCIDLADIPGACPAYTGPWLVNKSTPNEPKFEFVDHLGRHIAAVERKIRSAIRSTHA